MIFLSNFIFAYTKFVNNTLKTAENLTNPEFVEKITKNIIEQIKLNNSNPDDSENIIKVRHINSYSQELKNLNYLIFRLLN